MWQTGPGKHLHLFEYNHPRHHLQDASSQIRLLQVVSGNDYPNELQNKITWKTLPPQYLRGRICCTMTSCNIEDAPAYIAASYLWGGQSSAYSIEIDGKQLGVPPNAYNTILKIDEHKKGGYIWIDSVCTNQRNHHEKKKQVSMMGRIYEHAEMVIGNVGGHDSHSRPLISALNKYEDSNGSDGVAHPASSSDLAAALVAFSEREYWSRLWVIQECIAAKRLHLMCAHEMVDFRGIERLVSSIEEELGLHIAEPSHSHMWEILRCRRQAGGQLEFEDAILKFGRWLCKDPRDHIYGLLYLIKWNEAAPLEPDYNISKGKVAMKAFLRCSTVAGIRSVCDALGLLINGPIGLIKAAFNCCTTFDHVEFLKQRMSISSIDELPDAKAAIRACSTLEDSLVLWKWLSGIIDVEQRLLLVCDRDLFLPTNSDMRHLFLRMNKAFALPRADCGDGDSFLMVPTLREALEFAELSDVLGCAGSDDDVKAILSLFQLPWIDFELALRVISAYSARIDPLTRARKWDADSLAQAAFKHSATMVGVILRHLGSTVSIGDRLTLAKAFLGSNTSMDDVSIVLRAMDVPKDQPIPEALNSLLSDGGVCLRRLAVFSQALHSDVEFDAAAFHIPPNLRDTFWQDQNETSSAQTQYSQASSMLPLFPQENIRLPTTVRPGSGQLHRLSLCDGVLVTPKAVFARLWSLAGLVGLGMNKTYLHGMCLMGFVGGMWIVLKKQADETDYWRMSALVKFVGGDRLLRMMLSDFAQVIGRLDLYMSVADLSIIASASQSIHGDRKATIHRSLSEDSEVSIRPERTLGLPKKERYLAAPQSDGCSCRE